MPQLKTMGTVIDPVVMVGGDPRRGHDGPQSVKLSEQQGIVTVCLCQGKVNQPLSWANQENHADLHAKSP